MHVIGKSPSSPFQFNPKIVVLTAFRILHGLTNQIVSNPQSLLVPTVKILVNPDIKILYLYYQM